MLLLKPKATPASQRSTWRICLPEHLPGTRDPATWIMGCITPFWWASLSSLRQLDSCCGKTCQLACLLTLQWSWALFRVKGLALVLIITGFLTHFKGTSLSGEHYLASKIGFTHLLYLPKKEIVGFCCKYECFLKKLNDIIKDSPFIGTTD